MPKPSTSLETEIARWRCIGDDGAVLTVVELQHLPTGEGRPGHRRYPGARRLALTTGELVRYIDIATFEVVATGELLRRLA